MEPPDPRRPSPKKHLYIILTEIFEGHVLLVNITKTSGGSRSIDEACILQPGDHPFITQESFVFYKEAILLDEAEFTEKYKTNKALGLLNKGVFQRVCDGLCESKRTTPKLKDFYKRYIESLPPR